MFGKKDPVEEVVAPLQLVYINKIRPILTKIEVLRSQKRESETIYIETIKELEKYSTPFNIKIVEGIKKYPKHELELTRYIIANNLAKKKEIVENLKKE